MKKINAILSALGILVLGAIVITALVITNQTKDKDRFSVSGSGTVYAQADIANIEIGLRTATKKTALEAVTDNTKKMNEIIAAVGELGVEKKDIKTANYNLNPVYNYTQARGQELIGYEVYQNISLKIRDLDKIGEVIAKTTEQGANQVGNISFTIDDEYELKNQARELAINKAQEKAELIAAQSGMKLGRIKDVVENYYDYQPVMYSNAKLLLDASFREEGGMASPDIQSGQNEVKVEVTLVYEVK
ncbi:MAG: SIMPL domain-containing protein [Patescibacteria group bacterium]|jgi:uncharacterized protein YggE